MLSANPRLNLMRQHLPQNPDTALLSGTSWRPQGPSGLPSPCFHTRKQSQQHLDSASLLACESCITGIKSLLLHSSCLVQKKGTYLLFQPVIILNDACHHHISTLHVESDLSCRFILEKQLFQLWYKNRSHLALEGNVGTFIPELYVFIFCLYRWLIDAKSFAINLADCHRQEQRNGLQWLPFNPSTVKVALLKGVVSPLMGSNYESVSVNIIERTLQT